MTITTPTITPLNDHLRGLDGYRDAGRFCAIDAEVAAECTCTACGHVGLGYRAFIRPGYHNGYRFVARSYRAFAICGACSHAEEF